MKLFSLLLILLSSYAHSSEEFSRIHDFYTELFDAKISPPKISINPKGCLRTGYNIERHEVVFCNSSKTINAGLVSKDVMAHEFFHYYMCHHDRDFCNNSKNDKHSQAILEGFADAFAYFYFPDQFFGESFSIDKEYLRPYQSDYCYSLTAGVHDRGTSISTQLISRGLQDFVYLVKSKKYSLNDLMNQFQDKCFSRETGVSISSLDGTISSINKYNIKMGGRAFKYSFSNTALEKYGELKLALKESEKFTFRFNKDQIMITPSVEKGSEKVILGILSKGSVVGYLPLYLRVR